ncbi:hypothetical protein F5884DRAFT_806074 [Xylogone sp. PMI_703]|nr:hypothetical protein F5884DRAFT_806074 [Xylogone sp. PMI_703]
MKFVNISILALLAGMVAASPIAQEKRQTYVAYREGVETSQNEKRQTYVAYRKDKDASENEKRQTYVAYRKDEEQASEKN